MPTYQYIAQNMDGKKVKGQANAGSPDDLHLLLKEDDLFLLSCEEKIEKKHVKMLKSKQISEFCRQVGTLVGSGVSLVRALNIIAQQEGIKPAEKGVYEELQRMVRSGMPLSESMEELSGVFPALVINMFRSAEAAGNLERVAMQMATHYDKEWRLNGKVKNAMMYPKILGVLLVGVVSIIMGFVMPQFADMFANMESLPIPTVILMAISDFVQKRWYVLVAVFVGAFLLFQGAKSTPKIRLQMDRAMVHLPVIAALQRVIYTSRFSRSLASLYCSGLPIVSTLNIARHTIGNIYIDGQFDDVIPFVRSGGNLSDGLGKVDGFVKRLEFSIRVGEETGSLDDMLDSTADALEYESEMALERLVGFLEPAMIVTMALIVGFVMIAVIVPIYSSYQTIGAS